MPLFFHPTDEAKAIFTQLQGRWKALYAWGLQTKLPWQKANWRTWDAYESAWLAEKTTFTPPDLAEPQDTIAGISTQADTLNSVEQDAKDHGYGSNEPPVQTIDVTQTSEESKAASAVDDAAKAVEGAAKDAANAVAAKAKEFPWATVGVVAGCALVFVGVLGAWVAKESAPYVVPAIVAASKREEER